MGRAGWTFRRPEGFTTPSARDTHPMLQRWFGAEVAVGQTDADE